MRLMSASQVALAQECGGSFHLPRANRSSSATSRGTVIHRYLETGRLDDIPAEYRDECARIDLARIESFKTGGQALPEYAMAWNPWTDKARVLSSKDRDYQLEDGEVAGTADLVVDHEDHVVVIDYKTGRSEIPPAAENWQLRTLAVMASRIFGVDMIDVAILKLRDDGGWWTDAARFDLLDVDGFAGTIRKRLDAIKAADLNRLDVNEGEHCRWCPSLAYCPAKTALVKAIDSVGAVEALTPEDAGKAWLWLGRAQEVIDRMREALETRAAAEPLPLPNGKHLTLTEEQREYVSGPVVKQVLSELYGDEVAAQACETKVSSSKTAIQKVLGKQAKDALVKIGERGGLVIKKSQRVKAA